ncbi:dockerin type I repeat-containing protein [candidate division KSB1 bacterium]|nr:dockerin type I repeat-containing protein [candidate division KSB1 bacterium]
MKSWSSLFLIPIFILAIASFGFAQLQPVHFSFAASTGSNATTVIPLSIDPAYSDGQPLATGDEIGVFTPDSLCCGAVVWQEKSGALTIWGDNQETTPIDGFRAGEQLHFRVWQQSTDIECEAEVTFESGDTETFQANGFLVMKSLVAHLPERLRGDVNNDGALDIQDVMLIVEIILNKKAPTEDETWAADCNEDGVINVLDVVLLVKWILNP